MHTKSHGTAVHVPESRRPRGISADATDEVPPTTPLLPSFVAMAENSLACSRVSTRNDGSDDNVSVDVVSTTPMVLCTHKAQSNNLTSKPSHCDVCSYEHNQIEDPAGHKSRLGCRWEALSRFAISQ